METESRVDAYTYTSPQTSSRLPVLFCSPHSGRLYPETWVKSAQLPPEMLRRSEDMFVDELFSGVCALNTGLFCANFARAYVDLNRARDELDPQLVMDAPPVSRNIRVQSGLGVIPRVVGPKLHIHQGKISRASAEARLRQIWDPYHEGLRYHLKALPDQTSFKILVDCHSMPQAALDMCRMPKLEINLGTLGGRSCDLWVVEGLEAALEAEGFIVARNMPYAGAYVMSAYGRPKSGIHAVQIEIARRMYMDEFTLEKSREFNAVRERLTRSVAKFLEFCRLHGGLF